MGISMNFLYFTKGKYVIQYVAMFNGPVWLEWENHRLETCVEMNQPVKSSKGVLSETDSDRFS